MPTTLPPHPAFSRLSTLVGVGAVALIAGTVFVLAGAAQNQGAPQNANKQGAGQESAGQPATKQPAKDAPRDAAQPRTADMAAAKRQAFDITTTANGDLQAKNQIELRSKLEREATIQFVIPEGTRVKQGELLLQLNSDQIQQQIDEMTPRLASQRAGVVSAENQYQIQVNDNTQNLRKAELALELAQLQQRQWNAGDVVKRRKDLALKVDTAELELDRLADRLRRSDELLLEGFLSKDERDRDEVSYLQAIATYQQANLDRTVYEQYEYTREEKEKLSQVDEARAEVERVRLNNDIQLVSRDAERQNQKEQMTLLDAQFKKLQDQLGYCKITAPGDGLVVYATSLESGGGGRMWVNGSESSIQIGSQTFPNQLLLALPDTSQMIAVVRVHEAISGRIRPGQRATVRIDAAGGRIFDGNVDSIGVMAESGGWRDPNLREYTVRIALDSPDADALKPAMRVEARIMLDSVDETITVPVQALFSEGAVQYVYEPDGKKFRRIPVRVGRKSDTLAEVVGGLREGQTVLLRTPSAGEVISTPWDKQALADAGYQLDDKGEVIAGGGRGGNGPRQRGPRPTTVKRETPEPAAPNK